ncbi:MAG: zinc-dependent metalloprotease [Sediminibacterium sp.]|nr:zinc-dependent metalloprotease [Sediminibacterium sp.]
MKKIYLVIFSFGILFSNAQQTKSSTATTDTANKVKTDSTKKVEKKSPYKPYKEIITDKAVSQNGLFKVHKVEEKYYFEIADSILNREFLAVTRFAKVAGGGRRYGGEEVNEQSLKFEKGPNNNLFLRVVTLISYADSTQTISKAVANSYVDPIGANFDIKTVGKDSLSYVIDVTDFFKGDNQVVGMTQYDKKIFGITALFSDRSYIQSIKTYPINTEIRTTKTFGAIAGSQYGQQSGPFIPAAFNAGALTFELNTSLILLPKVPMAKRLFDPRVGYFADNYVVFSDDQQKVDDQVFAVRYRLEPTPEDLDKYTRGELVEPKKQIVYYIDPATPKKWVPFLIAGVNDWNIAFEKAGFKNAIVGKEWPSNDSTMSLEDARFSVIRYFASDIENAYGPQVHDPRSGEILESHIGWYHNVMKLVHDWYMIQTAAVDPAARKMKFDDELMGQLIRFVSSHEVGHTLGLRHNMGSSSKTPVENLRNKTWVEANGHTASIMDYARFNYVAQPEDKIAQIGLFPRIGDYDKWAIQWGYSYTGHKSEEDDKKMMNSKVIEALKNNPRVWFGGEGYNNDPRAQTEDLSDNNVKASEYGIKNLQFIIKNIPEWTKEEADKYENLSDIYLQLVIQFQRYMGHVTKNIGGIYETFKSVEQAGNVYEATPKSIQKNAVTFLNKQLFETPNWIFDKNILNKITTPNNFERIQSIQNNILNSLLDQNRMYRLVACNNRFGNDTYKLTEMLDDVRNGIFKELTEHQTISSFRRNIQKVFVEKLIDILNPSTNITISLPSFFAQVSVNVKNTDVPSEVRGQLELVTQSIDAALPLISDRSSKNHLKDLKQRIKNGLKPKGE